MDKKKIIFVENKNQIEIRKVNETEDIEGLGKIEITKQYIIHKVELEDRDLRDICKKYGAQLDEVEKLNDIQFTQFKAQKMNLKEIMIPYNNQQFIFKTAEQQAEELQ